MNKTKKLDVLIVYTHKVAASAGSSDVSSPFGASKKHQNYDVAYQYFLETCKKNGLTAGFTTSADIVDAGMASCYWTVEDKEWVKVNNPCFSRLVFDKFSSVDIHKKIKYKLLFSDGDVKPFNNPDFALLFNDKLQTYQSFCNSCVPTIAVDDADIKTIQDAVMSVKQLTQDRNDPDSFSKKIVLKDRFGAGGNKVFLISAKNYGAKIQKILREYKFTKFIIQPFVNFDRGYHYKNEYGYTDLRLIYIGKRIVQAYIRKASSKDFRCNEHQGGKLEYIGLREIPQSVRLFAEKIVKKLGAKRDLFALDLVITNSGEIMLMEGNIKPGLDWNLSLAKNEYMAKKLIRLIVKECKLRANLQLSQHARLEADFTEPDQAIVV